MEKKHRDFQRRSFSLTAVLKSSANKWWLEGSIKNLVYTLSQRSIRKLEVGPIVTAPRLLLAPLLD